MNTSKRSGYEPVDHPHRNAEEKASIGRKKT